MALPVGWLTDLSVLRLGGAQILDRSDHLIVKSPDNPGYHWGNFVFVTDPRARDDAQRWVAEFQRFFPDAEHLGIGLPAQPDPAAWAALGLRVEADDVLSTVHLPTQRPAPPGYTAERISGSQRWAGAERAEIAENAASGQFPAAQYARFLKRRGQTRRRLADSGTAAYFGAFAGDRCAAQLGIVLCDPDPQGRVVARFQDVLTDAHDRRLGLAGHLLGLAARWAGTAGARRWVIVTEPDSAAGRLYASLGFAPDTHSWRAVRPEADIPRSGAEA